MNGDSFLCLFSFQTKNFFFFLSQATPKLKSWRYDVSEQNSAETHSNNLGRAEVNPSRTPRLTPELRHARLLEPPKKTDGIFYRCLCRRCVVTSTSKSKHWQSRSTLTVTHEEHFLLSYTATPAHPLRIPKSFQFIYLFIKSLFDWSIDPYCDVCHLEAQ